MRASRMKKKREAGKRNSEIIGYMAQHRSERDNSEGSTFSAHLRIKPVPATNEYR